MKFLESVLELYEIVKLSFSVFIGLLKENPLGIAVGTFALKPACLAATLTATCGIF